MKNNNELLYAARQGYSDQALPVTVEPYLNSHCWLAYRAGNALAASGQSRPVKAAMSRGYRVRLQTSGGMECLAVFNTELTTCKIERV